MKCWKKCFKLNEGLTDDPTGQQEGGLKKNEQNFLEKLHKLQDGGRVNYFGEIKIYIFL